MPILTEDMKRVVGEPRLCFYATVCEFAKSGVKGGVRGRCAQTPGLDDTQSSASAPSTRPLSHAFDALLSDRFGHRPLASGRATAGTAERGANLT